MTLPSTAAAGGPPPAAATAVAGLDVGPLHDRHADDLAVRLARALPGPWAGGLTAATHACRDGAPHVTLSLEVGSDADSAWPVLVSAVDAVGGGALVLGDLESGPQEHREHARAAASEHAGRRSGRAVVFPGSAALPPELTVAELLARTAVDRVLVLAAGDAPPDAVLLTRGFVRPVWAAGVLVLHVQPAAGGVLVPFESPDPTPCCANHPWRGRA